MDDNPHVFISNIFELNTLRKTGNFCNVTLKVNEEEFCAHRLVLVAISDYFKALLSSDFAEAKQSTIEINGFEPEIVELIIGFAYTNQITITKTNALDLLTAADHFQILKLKNGVSDYLGKNICFLNCFDVFVATDMLNCENLRNICKSFILRNFQKVCKEDKFLNLPYKLLIEVTSDGDLFVEKEELVFEAVFRWMEFKPNERKPHLDEVLGTVRLDILNIDFLCGVVGDHPMLIESEKAQNQIKVILLSRSNSDRNSLAMHCKHRKMVFDKKGLAVGIDKRIWLILKGNNIATYDLVLHQLGPKLPPMNHIKNVLALASDGDNIFAIGYFIDGEKYIHLLEMFDVTSKGWRCFAEYSIDDFKRSFMVVSHQGKLYIKDSRLNCMHIFNIEKRSLEENLSTMLPVQNVEYCGMCYFQAYIYVFGDNYKYSQRYNISDNTWEMVDQIPLQDPLEIAVKDGKIFAKSGNKVVFYESYMNRWFPCKLNASQIF